MGMSAVSVYALQILHCTVRLAFPLESVWKQLALCLMPATVTMQAVKENHLLPEGTSPKRRSKLGPFTAWLDICNRYPNLLATVFSTPLLSPT